jgi:hypothetical protein
MGSSGIYSEDFQLICKNIHNLFIGKMENHLIEEYRYVQFQNINIYIYLYIYITYNLFEKYSLNRQYMYYRTYWFLFLERDKFTVNYQVWTRISY